MNPYEELGVERDATEADIKSAYRSASKRAHPDAGGSAEKFAQVSRSKALLLDPRRRAEYDKTGRTDEPKPDNDQANAIEVVLGQLLMAIGALEQKNARLETIDLVALTRSGIGDQIGQHELQIGDSMRGRALAKRFRAKKSKTNWIQRALEARVADMERNTVTLQDRVRILKLAHQIAGDHVYETEPEPAGFHPAWVMQQYLHGGV